MFSKAIHDSAGRVTFTVDHFYDFVPVWPKDGTAVPIRIQTLWLTAH